MNVNYFVIVFRSKHTITTRHATTRHDTMELATEPDVYSPSIDENGNYIDKIPSFNTNALANGLRCPCGTRKDKVYLSGPLFAAHCKTKTHEKWVQDLNTNKANFFTENQKLRDVVHAQKIMIGKMELELASKSMTINYLTHELTKIMTSGGGGHTATPSANDMLMF